MKSMIKKGLHVLRNFFSGAQESHIYRAIYRMINIEQDESGDYVVAIQVINKSQTFKMKPEEILANDKMTNMFSPTDVRTLTYLGYLDINAPKYKILAERLSENNASLVFAIQEKGRRRPVVKTAEEITADREFIENLSQKDAHKVGYTTASQVQSAEAIIKKQLLESDQDVN